MTIKIIIPGKPIPFRAPYVSRFVSFNPLHAEKNKMKIIVRSQYSGPIIEEGVSVTYLYYFNMPISWSKKKKLSAINGQIRPICRPDLDNTDKFTSDFLVGTVLKDDSLIVDKHCQKWYALEARTEIIIKTLTQADPLS